MKIVDLLKRESVELNGKVTSKPEAIEKMVALMAAGGNLADVEERRICKRRGKYNRNRRRNCDSTCQDSGSKSTGTCSYGRKRRGRL